MNPASAHEPPATPAQRLQQALTSVSAAGAGMAPTATALCELAGVSRNALYRYHPDVLHALHRLQHQRRRAPVPVDRQVQQQLREQNDALRLQASQLAALVDHYFCAWRESAALLQRRERELADLLRKNRSRPVSIRS